MVKLNLSIPSGMLPEERTYSTEWIARLLSIPSGMLLVLNLLYGTVL